MVLLEPIRAKRRLQAHPWAGQRYELILILELQTRRSAD